MNPTPAERAALDLARTLTPMPPHTAAALYHAPDLLTFARRHDRVRLAQTRLIAAAETWRERELRLSLYYRARRCDDRHTAAYYRVTALDRATVKIRRALLSAAADLSHAESAAYRLF